MSKKILYNFASRSRPDKCIACLQNIYDLSEHDNYEVIISADSDDLTMRNDAFIERVKEFKKASIYFGLSKTKIEAINLNVNLSDADIIMNHSDDFWFLKKGYDLQIIKDMEAYFPDTDGFLHYPDGTPSKDILCTYSIMGRKYYDRFGYIYEPSYLSVYCDNEATEVARRLKKYKYIDNQIFSHNHPVWKLSETDELYKRNENPTLYKKDGDNFQRRKQINFGL